MDNNTTKPPVATGASTSSSSAAPLRTAASSIRPSAAPASPHTPSRGYSSNFSSPGGAGSSFRQEEDVVILEVGSRYLRAGFEGDPSPQCCVATGPETSRRIGDYRDYEPSGGGGVKKMYGIGEVDAWARQREYWRCDLRGFDLGLFEDKIERATREVFNRYLLTDAGSQRLVLVLPSLLAHPLLASLLTLLFTRWNFSSISLLPAPTMAAVAAGLRSALVVDLGWEETTITTIYEYREIASLRSTRAMKQVVRAMAQSLYGRLKETRQTSETNDLKVDFDYAEEMVMRLGWCSDVRVPNQGDSDNPLQSSADSAMQSQSNGAMNAPDSDEGNESNLIEIDLPTETQTIPLQLPHTAFSEPIETLIFASKDTDQTLDEGEQSLPSLIFKALASLEPDVRGMCMARIIFVGGGSQIPGLSQRALDMVGQLASQHGWSKVRGSAVDKRREKLREINGNSAARRTTSPDRKQDSELDPIDERLRRTQLKEVKAPIQGMLRQVDSLGIWSGASLLSNIKTRGIVEVDRDRFLQHGGLGGAHREADISVLPSRQSLGPGMRGASERSSWTLAGWG